MDPRSVPQAESLPRLYRAVLDVVGDLERLGARDRALDLRRQAARAYQVWDAAGERRMRRLLGDAQRDRSGADVPGPADSRIRTRFRRGSRRDPGATSGRQEGVAST